MLSKLFFLVALAALVIAIPTPTTSPFAQILSRQAPAAAALLVIAPNSENCTAAPLPSECATNVQAAQFLPPAMEQYKIYNVYEISAILADIAFESEDFKYNTNQFPGRPGQGTRNMQEAPFNLMYAASITALKAPLAAITTATTVDNLSNATLNAIRALVLPDEYAWGSGPWFYTTQCSSSVKASLQTGTLAGWNAYLGCVGVKDTDGTRTLKWNAAMTAFGLPKST